MNSNTTLDTVIIFTERMQELAQFYADGLGIGPYESSPNHLGCLVGNVYFGFDQVDNVRGQAPAGVTLWFNVDDLQATFDIFVNLGATINSPPQKKPWGAILASLFDPDGNLVGLAQRNPK